MRRFKDNTGREWTLDLTIGDVKRVQSLIGVNLLDLTSGDPPLCTRLAVDVMLVCDVAFALVKPQADRLGVTDEGFGAVLGGEAIGECHRALIDEITDFFLRLGRTENAKMMTGARKLTAAAIDLAERKIDAIDMDSILASIAGESSTSLPESSASIPTP